MTAVLVTIAAFGGSWWLARRIEDWLRRDE